MASTQEPRPADGVFISESAGGGRQEMHMQDLDAEVAAAAQAQQEGFKRFANVVVNGAVQQGPAIDEGRERVLNAIAAEDTQALPPKVAATMPTGPMAIEALPTQPMNKIDGTTEHTKARMGERLTAAWMYAARGERVPLSLQADIEADVAIAEANEIAEYRALARDLVARDQHRADERLRQVLARFEQPLPDLDGPTRL